MKATLARLFARWANALSEDTRIDVVDPGLLDAARKVVLAVEADVHNASSENKHARAFGRLRRAFPAASKREVSIAIEWAVRDVS